MKIKVCGMKYPENIAQLARLGIDYMGFILYPLSSRYLMEATDSEAELEAMIREKKQALKALPGGIKKTGVVVNELPQLVLSYIEELGLDAIQLHGVETPEYCQYIRRMAPGTIILKAFGISSAEDLEQTRRYSASDCDFFLFDTRTPQHGGSGKKFDWTILDSYAGDVPFFLSGGITAEDAPAIRTIRHPLFYGVDLNSRFEIEPGLKNIELLNLFITQLRHESNQTTL